jgi:hypothetical protein
VDGQYYWGLTHEWPINHNEIDTAMRTDEIAHRFTWRWAIDMLDQWFELEPRSVDNLVQPYLEDMGAKSALINAWAQCRGHGTSFAVKIYEEEDLGIGQSQLAYGVKNGIPIGMKVYTEPNVNVSTINTPYPNGIANYQFDFKINGMQIHPSRIIHFMWWKPDSLKLQPWQGASALRVIWMSMMQMNRLFEAYTNNAIRWGPGLFAIGVDTNDYEELKDIDDLLGPLTAKGRFYYKKDQWEVGWHGPEGKMAALADIVTPQIARVCAGMKAPQASLIGSPRGNIEGSELDEHSMQSSLADDLLLFSPFARQLIDEILLGLGRKRLRYKFRWKFIDDMLPRMKTELLYKRMVALDYFAKSGFKINEVRQFASKLFQDYGMQFAPIAGGDVVPKLKELFTKSDEVEVKKKQAEKPAPDWKTPQMQAAEARYGEDITILIETKSARQLGVTPKTFNRWIERCENNKRR